MEFSLKIYILTCNLQQVPSLDDVEIFIVFFSEIFYFNTLNISSSCGESAANPRLVHHKGQTGLAGEPDLGHPRLCSLLLSS